MGQLFDWESPLGHKLPTGMMSILGPPRFTVTLKAEEGVLALERHLPGGRALGALCAEKAVFDLCYNGTSCSASQAPSCVHSLVYTPHKQRGITRIDFGSGLV